MHIVEIFHEADVGSCGEGFFITGNDDATDILVGFESIDSGTNAVDDIIIQGIHCLGAVDTDQAYFADNFTEDYLSHVYSPEVYGSPYYRRHFIQHIF